MRFRARQASTAPAGEATTVKGWAPGGCGRTGTPLSFPVECCQSHATTASQPAWDCPVADARRRRTGASVRAGALPPCRPKTEAAPRRCLLTSAMPATPRTPATPRRLAPATPSAFLRGTAAARCSSARSAGLRCLPVVVRAALPGSRRSPGAGQRGLIALRARADVRVRYSGRDVMAI